MEIMAGWRDQYLQAWNGFSQRKRYAIIGGAIALIAAIIGLSVWYGSKPDLVPLFKNMEAKDAGEVTARLSEAKISYDIQESRQGVTILVPSSVVHEARLDLAAEGLPHGTKGFEIFDDSKLGVTEFQNKVNYLQAMQGELTRTIEQIAAVQKARVHIVFPEDSLYKKNEKPATASIMLMLMPNQQLSKKEINVSLIWFLTAFRD
jgi:flagellar M-ring protein FliF